MKNEVEMIWKSAFMAYYLGIIDTKENHGKSQSG
jgi:hypothetical protein